MPVLLKVKERIVGPSGYYSVQNEWYGYQEDFRYTIGLPGLKGFGVGCCRPEVLPPEMTPLRGCHDRESPNYGNYRHEPSASIVCFLPSHYIEIQGGNNSNGPHFGQPVVISSYQTENSVLPRTFRNGGEEIPGIFIDKYPISNGRADGSGLPNTLNGQAGEFPLEGGISVSRPLHWPVSASAPKRKRSSPFSFLNSQVLNPGQQTPSNNLEGCWAVARSRGLAFHPVPIWVYSHLAFLSLAHTQALLGSDGLPIEGATSRAAWMDAPPYSPKGNNNLWSDNDAPAIQFRRFDVEGNSKGRPGQDFRAYTDAAWVGNVSNSATGRTTHNGQLNGIVGLNGNQWECAPGLTNIDGTPDGYRMVADSVDWASLDNNDFSQIETVSLIPEESDNGIWWSDSNSWVYLTPTIGGTFHPTSSWAGQPTRRAMTECLLPRSAGTSLSQEGTSQFGGDGFRMRHVQGLLPLYGGSWAYGSTAGIFSVCLDRIANSVSNRRTGCRSLIFPRVS